MNLSHGECWDCSARFQEASVVLVLGLCLLVGGVALHANRAWVVRWIGATLEVIGVLILLISSVGAFRYGVAWQDPWSAPVPLLTRFFVFAPFVILSAFAARWWRRRRAEPSSDDGMSTISHEALFTTLLERQRRRGYADENTRAANLVWLHTDLGPSFYLSDEGRVFYDDPTLSESLRPATEDETSVGLVVGARNLEAPQLLEFLLPCPERGVACPRCGGGRWWPLASETKAHVRIVCPECRGRGWTLAAV